MFTVILPIILTFILSTIVGNFLVHGWQQRNWLQQQRLLRAQQQLGEFKQVIDEMMTLGNARYYRSRKLLRNIGVTEKERLAELKKDYDQAVTAWNDKYNFFWVQLTVYAKFRYAERLEENIQVRFIDISATLDQLLRPDSNKDILNQKKAALEDMFDILSGKLFVTFRDLTNELVDRQEETYLGKKIFFSEDTLSTFSTWYLFKALFKKDNPPQSIIGPITDLHIPTVFRI